MCLAEEIQERALAEWELEERQVEQAWEAFFQSRREREKFYRELWAQFQALLKLSDTDPMLETAQKEFSRKLKMGPKYL